VVRDVAAKSLAAVCSAWGPGAPGGKHDCGLLCEGGGGRHVRRLLMCDVRVLWRI
jgi:hypothetical protein